MAAFLELQVFSREWARCAPWIAAALEFGRDTHSLNDVLAEVLAGEAQFWPGERSAVVTEMHEHPRLRAVHLWLCGGDLTELVEGMLPAIEAWARANNCSRLSTCGRKGWDRVLKPKGFEPAFHVAIKEL